MAKMVMPPARLEARTTDIPFTDDLLSKLSLFAQLKRKVSLDKYPGTLVIRRYRAGEVICRQGDAGWTAFYGLTPTDALILREAQLQTAPEGREKKALQVEVDVLKRSGAVKNTAPRRVATFYLTLASPTPVRRQGLIETLVRRWTKTADAAEEAAPVTIAIDAPTMLDYETRQAAIHEGELFGEMSCQYGTPRSATVLADGDCYLLEMLRNILDQVQKDPSYKARLDDLNKKRVFALHLRRLSLFADLTDAQFDRVRDQIELQSCGPGQIIYDEHEQSDDVYLVRTGLVRVVKKASALLAPDQVRDWQRMGKGLGEGETRPTEPIGKVWTLLPEGTRAAARTAAAASRSPPEAERRALLNGLNEVIKNRQLPDAKEMQPATSDLGFQARAEGFPEKRKEWADQDFRRYNRLLLEHLLGNALRAYHRRVGPDCVLSYCAQGEFIGEAAALGEGLRGETCLAHGHPKDVGTAQEAGPVELVRIPGAVFTQLLEESPTLLRKVERKVAERRRQTQELVRVPVWDESRQVLLSERFESLGLIQGQRLMLIDLDRCTRCDECVRACVATHADGRSRLYLDGPRFGNYLVPTTCRSCLDPVCMIGCPVGSIHRGDNGQMVIEDWCIGCGLCAQQCPYGSIRMDDIGIIAETAPGWRYLPLSGAGKNQWMQPGYRDVNWLSGRGPFQNDRDFRESLARYLREDTPAGSAARRARTAFSLPGLSMGNLMAGTSRVGQPVCFRHEFTITREAVRGGSQFRLEVTAPDPATKVWVNGQEVQPADKPGRGGKREYWFPPRPPAPEKKAGAPAPPPPPAAPPPMILRAGKNVLAISVAPDAGTEGAFLTVRLDEVRKPKVTAAVAEEITQKPVLERAVVCDLCSTQLGQVPACVNACPHDAALRIDARSEFPVS
jgi:Fe-S-cluster-containing hydrogenase component 2